MRQKIILYLAGVFIVVFFICYSAANPTPQIGYHAKFSIFYRNYKQYGVFKNRLFPHYNSQMTNPPSIPVVAHSPFMPLVMYTAANFFGDKPATYSSVIIAINAIFFILLYMFVTRWWGQRIALWTLFFSALSGYALAYADLQTYEQICLVGGFSAIFLYFEWLKTKQARFFVLCALAYIIGFVGDYSAFFAALIICLHWIFFIKDHNKGDFLKISFLPVVTVGYLVTIIFLMHSAGISLSVWLGRISTRLTGNQWNELVQCFFKYNLILIGIIPLALSSIFFIFKIRHKKNGVKFPFESHIMYALFIAGLAPVILLGNAYINHPFFVMSLVPFFAISAALGVDILLNNTTAIRVRQLLVIVIVLGFLTQSFYVEKHEKRKSKLWYEYYKQVISLSSKVKPYLKTNDRLFIFPDKDDLHKLTVFCELSIPSDAVLKVRNWKEIIASKNYSLILTTDLETFNLIKGFPECRILVSDGYIAFFRIIGGNEHARD